MKIELTGEAESLKALGNLLREIWSQRIVANDGTVLQAWSYNLMPDGTGKATIVLQKLRRIEKEKPQ